MKLTCIRYLSVLLLCCTTVFAQEGQYTFSHLDVNAGLSHNGITCIIKDSKGFLWFGTSNGLNRYDGSRFKVYKHQLHDSASLSDNFITSIYDAPDNKFWIKTQSWYSIYDPITDSFDEDVMKLLKPLGIPDYQVEKILKAKNGDFYFLHATSGLFILNHLTGKVKNYIAIRGDATSLHGVNVADMAEDSKGNLWIAYQDGWIEMFDTRTNKVVYHTPAIERLAAEKKADRYNLFIDRDDDIWLYSKVGIGVYYINPFQQTVRHIHKDSEGSRLNTYIVNAVIQDNEGKIWIGTDQGGINLLDKKDFSIQYLLKKENDNRSIRQNSVTTLYNDPSGMIWLGTYKTGIDYYHPSIRKFPLFSHNALQPGSLGYNDINAFAEDAKGNLWIGTNGGGLIYFNRQTGSFTPYLNNKANTNSLSNNVIVSLCVDHEQKLWIGTYFGGLDCYDGKTFTHYRHHDADTNSISDNRIYEIMEDSDHNIWVATLSGGLNMFDRNKKTFKNYRAYRPGSIHSDYVFSLFEDKKKNIWIGTSDGIDVLQKETGEFLHYQHENTDANSLVNNNVFSLIEDSRGNICIGTREGLNILDPRTNKFSLYRTEDGLPDNNILAIQEDRQHNLWVSTANGISNVIISNGKNGYKLNFINYDEKDGLQGKLYNEDASFMTRAGEMIFAGGNGFNLFDPAMIKMNRIKPVLVFTDFQMFNHTVKPGEKMNGQVILAESITRAKSIVLKYNQNFFSIEFAALDFLNPDKVRYQYMMEGLDENWVTSDNKIRKATYTNLDPGNYVFKVRASSDHASWNEKELSLNIQILPPFWKTTLAYVCYAVGFLAGLFYLRYRGIRKIRIQFLQEQEKQEAQRIQDQKWQEAKRMHELDRLKIKFLTNVSHEFRTPLSLIMAPVDKMLQHPQLAEHIGQMNLIKRNARRLLNLVNQLLDFRKMEVHELKLDLNTGDIIKFIKDVSFSFMDIADQNRIRFTFDTDTEQLDTTFDHDKIERVLFNLLSNAFKFTPPGGDVSVLLNCLEEEVEPGIKLLKINVMDTGIGIPADKMNKVFERFYQHDIPTSLINQGSGIGLAITKEFVKMHQGKITIEQIPTGGSCFIVELPLPVLNEVPATTEETPGLIPGEMSKVCRPGKLQHKKPIVLLVEDNEDFRFYLKDNLRETFNMLEAVNGKEGWQKALALHPDLIVSDISMPEMNGLELCAKIKNDSRTSHIPIILLTALMGEEYQMKGLETGANDYLTKPFNFEVLLSRIRNLLTLQTTIKNVYTKQVDVQLSDVPIQSVDEKFMANVLTYIEENLQHSNLTVEELSKHMCMSRVSLYKKMLTLTGKTPVDFIRSIRLRKAAQMLEKSQLSIAEISYEVGFNTPHYFAKSFKAEFDVLPSVYVKQFREEKDAEKTAP
ncbi:two-component regulator propeller domain-containing protein [Chitinophaga sp. MM2321]|uniref:hybrid sensor histidine kinase/response regulator transcription factor n=1 Tax=Chitinophaga sp. MM2321 TaxID=3137178 RepID=UPI0032D56793